MLIILEFTVSEHDKWLVRIQPCIYSANAFISIQGEKKNLLIFFHYMSSAQLTIIFLVKYWQITAFLFWLAWRFMAISINLFALYGISFSNSSMHFNLNGFFLCLLPFQYCLLTFNIFCFFILLTKLHWWKLICKVDSPVCIEQDWNPQCTVGFLQ